MIKCPFYPHCKEEDFEVLGILMHVEHDHKVVRGRSYGDAYHGNGSRNTLEINNDKDR